MFFCGRTGRKKFQIDVRYTCPATQAWVTVGRLKTHLNPGAAAWLAYEDKQRGGTMTSEVSFMASWCRSLWRRVGGLNPRLCRANAPVSPTPTS